MLIFRYYDEENRIDHAWYDSSNIVYSSCDDKLNDLKTLKVVFKNGASYTYKNVDVNDYLLFMAGGLDGSNGKALNQFIKSKYEYEANGKIDLSELNGELEYFKKLKENKNKNSEKNGEEN